MNSFIEMTLTLDGRASGARGTNNAHLLALSQFRADMARPSSIVFRAGQPELVRFFGLESLNRHLFRTGQSQSVYYGYASLNRCFFQTRQPEPVSLSHTTSRISVSFGQDNPKQCLFRICQPESVHLSDRFMTCQTFRAETSSVMLLP